MVCDRWSNRRADRQTDRQTEIVTYIVVGAPPKNNRKKFKPLGFDCHQ